MEEFLKYCLKSLQSEILSKIDIQTFY